MFAGWQTFYQMTGEAAATLTGLLFLVVSLMSGRPVPSTSLGNRLFTSPTVFHMVSVLVISAVALAPAGVGDLQSMAVLVWAGLGAAHALMCAVRLSRLSNPSHWSDFWWYGFAPSAAYLVLAVAAALTWVHIPYAAYLVAASLMALLVGAIRNAWDLVTWLAPRREGPEPKP
jgi:hypothetical protein